MQETILTKLEVLGLSFSPIADGETEDLNGKYSSQDLSQGRIGPRVYDIEDCVICGECSMGLCLQKTEFIFIAMICLFF